GTGMIPVSREVRQRFASKDNRPRSKKCRRSAVIFNHHLDIWKLKYGSHGRRAGIAESELLNFEGRNRNSRSYVSALFCCVGSVSGGLHGASQDVALDRHFSYLSLHGLDLQDRGPNLIPHLLALVFHLCNLPVDFSQAANGSDNAANSDEDESEIRSVCRDKQFTEVASRLAGMIVLLPLGCLLIYYYDCLTSRVGRIAMFGSGVSLISVGMGLDFLPVYNRCEGDNYNNRNSHSSQLYYKKCLTVFTFCTTVSDVANVLNTEKQTAIIAMVLRLRM